MTNEEFKTNIQRTPDGVNISFNTQDGKDVAYSKRKLVHPETFNLSSKIFYHRKTFKENTLKQLYVKDVKEFIRRLKDWVASSLNGLNMTEQLDIMEQIDSLAGEELI